MILAQELETHGMSSGPIDVELALDHLWDTKSDQWMTLGKGVTAVARFGIKAFRASRGNEQLANEFKDKFEHAEEFKAPEPAFFETPTDDRQYVGVELNPEVDAALEHIYELTWPKVMGAGIIREAWLTQTDHRGITVHIGEWEIGTIPASATGAFDQTIKEATFREELPTLRARIARLGDPPRYVVEVGRPAPW
jgi:hypothetical protein